MLFTKVEKIEEGAGMEGGFPRWGRGGHWFELKKIHIRYNVSVWHHIVVSHRIFSTHLLFFPFESQHVGEAEDH